METDVELASALAGAHRVCSMISRSDLLPVRSWFRRVGPQIVRMLWIHPLNADEELCRLLSDGWDAL